MNAAVVLAEPEIDVKALEDEIADMVSLVSAENLPDVKKLIERILIRQDEEYVPLLFDDLSPDVQQAAIDAENGIFHGPVMSFDEFYDHVRDAAAEIRTEHIKTLAAV